jgi:hypothetical protein
MADETTITDLQAHIRDLELELADAKKFVNRLLARHGQPPIYADVGIADGASATSLQPDTFYNKPLMTAMKDFLKMRRATNQGPADIHTMYKALVNGGFKFETDNEENRKKNLKVSLTKNASVFHRLPGAINTYGLTEWYGIPPKDQVEPDKRKKRRAKKSQRSSAANKNDIKPVIELKPSGNSGGKIADNAAPPKTMVDALQAAVRATTKEFTKQDLIDWIDKHYPDLKAGQKKSSVFAMIANLKDELKIETAHAGKGKEPHRFRRVLVNT